MPQPETWQPEPSVKFTIYGTRASSLELEYKEQSLHLGTHAHDKRAAHVPIPSQAYTDKLLGINLGGIREFQPHRPL